MSTLTLEMLNEAKRKVEGLMPPPELVIVQSVVERPRSWKERLFTLPWNPRQKNKWVDNPIAPPDGRVLDCGEKIICNERTFDNLQREMSVRASSEVDRQFSNVFGSSVGGMPVRFVR